MTLRDYKEVFFRTSKEKRNIQSYIERLAFFESWPDNNRFLVRYEDLMNNPYKFISNLSKFLNADRLREKELLDNFEMFKNKVRNSYEAGPGKNRYPDHYSPSLKQIQELESYLKKQNPVVFEKYLTPYSK